jgi:hypothetical protein
MVVSPALVGLGQGYGRVEHATYSTTVFKAGRATRAIF